MSDSDDLRQAKDESHGCPYCSGEGLTTIFHRDYRGEPYAMVDGHDGYRRRKLLRSAAYCACNAGQAISRNHERTARDIFARMPDVRVVMANPGSEWSTDDPTMDLDQDAMTWAQLKAAMARRPVAEGRPGPPRRGPIRTVEKVQEAVPVTEEFGEYEESACPF